MTEAERDALRVKILASNQRMQDQLAPFYLGKDCPVFKEECRGPKCQWFLPMAGPDGKIAQAACAIPLLATTAGPISDGLAQLAMQLVQSAQQNGPRVLAPPPGLLK